MSMVIYERYLNIGEALVVYSALEAGGFHPVFHNYHHAYMDCLKMLALGGLIILIPKNEVDNAKVWISHLQKTATLDADPIPTRKYGMWKRASFLGLFNMGLIFPIFLPFCFLPTLFSLLICMLLLIFPDTRLIGFALIIFPVSIMAHAQYIALPRIQYLKDNANEY